MNKLYLIEGHSAFFRAVHTTPPMTEDGSETGVPINGLYGYSKMLWNMLLRHTAASHIAVILDAPNSRKHRLAIFPGYKATREPTKPEIASQIPRIREVTEAFGLPCVEVDGYEADDVIASYAVQAVQDGFEVVIVTIDKDMTQMIGAGIQVFDPMIVQRMLVASDIVKKFGEIPTSAIPCAQALIGDKVDNIPGCPGVGKVQAAKLLSAFGSIDGIYANIDAVEPQGLRVKLVEGRDSVALSRQLTELKLDVPLEVPIADFAWSGIDHDRLQTYMQKMGFKTLAEEMAA